MVGGSGMFWVVVGDGSGWWWVTAQFMIAQNETTSEEILF